MPSIRSMKASPLIVHSRIMLLLLLLLLLLSVVATVPRAVVGALEPAPEMETKKPGSGRVRQIGSTDCFQSPTL